MRKTFIFYTCTSLVLIAIVGLFYQDHKAKQPFATPQIDIQIFDEIRGMVETHQDEITAHLDLKPFAPTQEASLASPFCSGKYYFDNTFILNRYELGAALSQFGSDIKVKKSPEEAWFAADGTFGLLLKSSGGIGFFRDYYHEVVYDPHSRIKTETLEEKCYPTILVKELSGQWKYRVVSSQWD